MAPWRRWSSFGSSVRWFFTPDVQLRSWLLEDEALNVSDLPGLENDTICRNVGSRESRESHLNNKACFLQNVLQ